MINWFIYLIYEAPPMVVFASALISFAVAYVIGVIIAAIIGAMR